MASRYSLTAAMLLDRFTLDTLVQLTDGNGASYDAAIIDKAIESEENDFEGSAGVFYALPVRTSSNTVPGIVTERLLDGVAIRLLCRKPEFVFEDGDMQPWWERRMKTLDTWKAALSDPARKVKIPDATERGTVTETNSAAVKTSSVAGSYCAGFMTGGRR